MRRRGENLIIQWLSLTPHLRDLKQFRRIEIIDVKTFVGKVKGG
jgi:hypothetical protein